MLADYLGRNFQAAYAKLNEYRPPNSLNRVWVPLPGEFLTDVADEIRAHIETGWQPPLD